MKPKIFNYESYGGTLNFAENLGWVEPKLDSYYVDGSDARDALEDDALEFIEKKGYAVVMGL